MTRPAVRGAGRALVALVLLGAIPAWPQGKPTSGEDPSDLVNSLLAGLLGFSELGESELAAEVAEVGGVPFKTRVAVEYMGKEQLARYLKELFDAEYPVAEAEADRRTLLAFDLLSPGSDLRALRAKVLEENVVGFYDERPDRRRLYVVSEDKRLTPMNQLVLSHELRHALQDQYMNIHGLVDEGVSDYDDRQLALLSLLEGDATFVMERFLGKRLPEDVFSALEGGGGVFGLGAMSAAAVPGAPPVVRDQLVLPYFAGRDFVQALHRQGGWEAVRAAWANPPASMEQVLHPEKYRAREAPLAVDISFAPNGGRKIAGGVLGEALIRTLLGDMSESGGAGRAKEGSRLSDMSGETSEEGAPSAAAGWGGDLFRVWDVSGHTLLVWRTRWDAPAGAQRFATALRARFERSHGPGSPLQGFTLFGKGQWTWAVGSAGGDPILLSSDDAGLLTGALRAFR